MSENEQYQICMLLKFAMHIQPIKPIKPIKKNPQPPPHDTK